MGFRQPGLEDAYSAIRRISAEITSSRNDGWVASGCKQDLYQLKCWLDDHYDSLPTFIGEEKWEQDRVVQILSRK
jgi:hypothetical protein